ncbi:hypothetical protein, partial [Leucobacter sp. OH1287]|uniref:hypothetical protein n=1 Tax=Leucobacter sp. OH1287 TaxID=2491049 RepID=UPI00131538A0
PTYEPAPAAPSFELTAAACVNNKAVNNLLTVDPAEKKDNYRFVATLNGQSISLKEELRNKLWADGKISAEDIATAYPGFKVPYGETITVQPYWFDAEKVNDPA